MYMYVEKITGQYSGHALKSLQNKKGQKYLGYPKKGSLFTYKRTVFLSGTPNFLSPSYFEAALVMKDIAHKIAFA